MSSQRSLLGKWALHRRWEAHLTFPLIATSALILIYFFLPGSLVAPGFIDLPFGSGRKMGLSQIAMGLCLAWSLVLCFGTLTLTRDRSVWVITVLIAVCILLSLALWVDGHSLMSRASGLIKMAAEDDSAWTGMLTEYQGFVGLAMLGLFSLFFFVAMPLVYGDSRSPVVAMLIPSRWLVLPTLIMFVAFWVAYRLNAMGWVREHGDAQIPNLALLVKPVFVYMLLLYLARLQYLTWVRREAQHWNPSRGYR